jgi:hypothetical protein
MSNQMWTVWGVAELGCWILHRPDRWTTGRDAEDCIDAHIDMGINHIAWDLGRSVLQYHSDLPQATSYGVGKHYDEFYPQASAQRKAEMQACHDRCQLRVALMYGKERGCTVYGRLCMNRHYHPGSSGQSRFSLLHPEWHEVGKDGWLDTSRMCYAIPEYRQERVSILKEAVEIGCDGLFLDFLRQPPALRYHPALVNKYREKTGVDARSVELENKDRVLDWCRFRAEFVTESLRELNAALDPFRQKWGRRVPVQVRIPNDGFEANMIAGFDILTWCNEGLIDELALSELHWLPGYTDWDDRPYIALVREHGIPVFGGSNCLPVQRGGWGGKINPFGVNPLVLARRVLKSMEDGASGTCLYQSDTGAFLPGVPEAIAAFQTEERLRAYVGDPAIIAANPVTEQNREYGIDNHSDTRENLEKRIAANTDAAWL